MHRVKIVLYKKSHTTHKKIITMRRDENCDNGMQEAGARRNQRTMNVENDVYTLDTYSDRQGAWCTMVDLFGGLKTGVGHLVVNKKHVALQISTDDRCRLA